MTDQPESIVPPCDNDYILGLFSKQHTLPVAMDGRTAVFRRMSNLPADKQDYLSNYTETQDQIIRDMMNSSPTSPEVIDNTTCEQEVFSLNHRAFVTMDNYSAPMGYRRPENSEDKHCNSEDNLIT